METYRKVFIKTEADLPKQEGIYIVKCADNDTPEFMRLAKHGNVFWHKVAWYLQPVTAKTEQEPDKERTELMEKYGVTEDMVDDYLKNKNCKPYINTPFFGNSGAKVPIVEQETNEQPKRVSAEKTERQIIMEVLNCYKDNLEVIDSYKFNSVALDIINELRQFASQHPIEQEKPSESAEEFLQKKYHVEFISPDLKVSKKMLIECMEEYASQKHPVTDDMISAKLDTVNFETSKERETAFDLLVWLRDLTGQRHLPTDEEIEQQLDNMGVETWNKEECRRMAKWMKDFIKNK